jgi:hypothetical protein
MINRITLLHQAPHSWVFGPSIKSVHRVKQLFNLDKLKGSKMENKRIRKSYDRDFKAAATKRLNNRPRKRLGYKTPNEVFFGEAYTVALTT